MASHSTVGGKLRGDAGGALRGAVSEVNPLTTLDSGLPRPQREIVQLGVVDLLQRLLVANGGYLEAVEPTQAIVESADDDRSIAEILDQLGGRTPAVMVSTGDASFETAGDVDRWKVPTRVHVYFFNNAMRSKLERTVPDVVALADPKADPGVFVAMEHVRMLLCGRRPGGTTHSIAELKPIRERRVAADPEVTIWEQTYSVQLGIVVNMKRDISLELTQINAYHRLAEQASTDDPIVSTETEVNE